MRVKKPPVSVSSNWCASRMLPPFAKSSAVTRATMPGWFGQDSFSRKGVAIETLELDEAQEKMRSRYWKKC